MEILVFKTNIHKKDDILKVSDIFNRNKDILAWNVDLEDIDRVLRIEAIANISSKVKLSLSHAGFYCRELE
jgi:hypothetical protein